MKKILVNFIELYIVAAVTIFTFTTLRAYWKYGEFQVYEGNLIVPLVITLFLVTTDYISERRLMK